MTFQSLEHVLYHAVFHVNQEFLELQEIVFSDEKCSDAVSSDKTLAVMTRKYGNRICVIALNPEKSPVNAVLRLPAEFRYADRAEVSCAAISEARRNEPVRCIL